MKVSVIVPTYKPQAYLWECLESIYRQTLPKSDYELVIVLNGCKEPFNVQIIKWLSKHQDMQVQFFQIDEGGVSNARNMALDNAKGDFVAFIDDDDLISPLYLEELYKMSNSNIVSLCYPYAFKDGVLGSQLHYRITDAYDYCVQNNCVNISSRVRKFFSGPCMKLIPMSFIQDRRFDVRFKNGEDSLFMFLISDKIHKVAFTSEKAVYYRRYRTGSAINVKRSIRTVIKNQLKMIKVYSFIYFSNPMKYSFSFYLTRIMGAARAVFHS